MGRIHGTSDSCVLAADTLRMLHDIPSNAPEFAESGRDGRVPCVRPVFPGPARADGGSRRLGAQEALPSDAEVQSQAAVRAAVARARRFRSRGRRSAPGLPVISGELNPVFQGTYSSRIEVKQAPEHGTPADRRPRNRNAWPCWDGPPAREAIDAAWEPVLFNQAHDLSSGVMVDKVFDDSMLRLRSRRGRGSG